jgi:2-oxo-4-hydroxy-4-carboxy-5-ureidoimidazoline decarboxylase
VPEFPRLPPQSRGGADRPTGITRLNDAPADAAEATLLACCGSLRWARRVAAHRPYPDLDSLLAAADEAAYDLAPADLCEALAAEAAATAPLPPRGGLAALTALRAAHAAYEARFGHVLVMALDGVHPDELLDHLLAGIRARLLHEPDEERATAADQLRRVTRGRLTRLVAGAHAPSRT